MSEMDEIHRRLNQLESENEQLKQQLRATATAAKPKVTTTFVAMWQGHPVIRFEGNFRPFGLGLKKAAIVLEKIDDVKHFVENNKQHLHTAPDDAE